MAHLNFSNHNRHFLDFSYIYPVASRRSQGLSLGINLNINNSCNWRCIYCQVEGLVRGKPEPIDLVRLEYELDYFINLVLNSNFLVQSMPIGLQRFNDIALAGNGEPTLSNNFLQVIQIITKLKHKYQIDNLVKTILITNGSKIGTQQVDEAIKLINEVWFKLDSVNEDEIKRINQVDLSLTGIIDKIKICSSLCKTFIQTCLFKTDNINPQLDNYIETIVELKPYIAGVLLYSVARNPALAEGKNISSFDVDFLENITESIGSHGIVVKYYK